MVRAARLGRAVAKGSSFNMWEEFFKKMLSGYMPTGSEQSTLAQEPKQQADARQVERLGGMVGTIGSFVSDPYQNFGDANRALITAMMQGRPATQSESENMANAVVDSMGETGTITKPGNLARLRKNRAWGAIEQAVINGVQAVKQ